MDFSRISVLVVEDQAFVRRIICKLLENFGILKVTEATDGGEALEALMPGRYDLVLLDVEMEPMDGITCLRNIRSSSSPEIRDQPVIILTTHAEEETVSDLMELGVQGYVVKPVRPNKLKSSIERAMTDHWYGRKH